MISVIATMTVQPGQGAAFEAEMRAGIDYIRANEPGTLFYHLARSREDETVYKILEAYRDQAALDAHMQSEWYLQLGGKMRNILARRPLIEQMDGIV
jgi:quinol monooxygenase YgiN